MAYNSNGNEDYNDYSGENSAEENVSNLSIPIQDTKAQTLKAEIKQDVTKEIQTQIKTEIQAATSPLGSVTGYFSIGAITLSVVSILLLIVMRNALVSKINKLTTISNSQKEAISKLNSELMAAKNEIRTLKRSSETSMSRYEVENFPPPPKMQTPPPVQVQAQPSLHDKLKDFIEDFNALADFKGVEYRKRREEFFAKYQIKGFTCQNFNERMNNPNLEPVFESLPNPINCDYWAYEISSDKFAVVPNIKDYNENCHIPRAMIEVFNSNFAGGIYANIRVLNPAIFNGMWHLDEKGELVLS